MNSARGKNFFCAGEKIIEGTWRSRKIMAKNKSPFFHGYNLSFLALMKKNHLTTLMM